MTATATADGGRSVRKTAALDRVFFYGTLRSGQAARSLISDHVLESEAATVPGRLYAFADGYPGAVLDPDGGRIVGEVVRITDLPAAFALLDAYEGDEFVRVRVDAELARGGRTQAWCYLLASAALAADAKLVESGDWVAYDRDL